MTVLDITKRYNITKGVIYYRAKNLNIKSIPTVERIFTEDEVNAIINYEYKKRAPIYKKALLPNKIQIIDLYLNSKNNGCKQISDTLNLNWNYVSKVIDEWLKNDKTITVISKL